MITYSIRRPFRMANRGPNSLLKREANRLPREPLAGTTVPTTPGHPRASTGTVFADQMNEPTRGAGRIPCRIPPYKRGVTGSNPVAPTKFVQLDSIIETLI